MTANNIFTLEGLSTEALSEAFKRVRAALGDKVEGGRLPMWGPGEGGASLQVEGCNIALNYFAATDQPRQPSRLDVLCFGSMPEQDIQRIVDVLQNPPLSRERRRSADASRA